MTEGREDDATPDDLDMFDDAPDAAARSVVCRVCGSLVAATGEYRRAHWDWHEASNGA